MNKEDKKLQKHLVDEMMKVSKTNPDVMIYMQALMKKYEELEQENINIKQQLLENKISLKDVEYQEKIKYKNIIKELEKDLWKVRQLTFTKYNSNEWNNCLSFNDDIKPILDKLKALKENNKDVR